MESHRWNGWAEDAEKIVRTGACSKWLGLCKYLLYRGGGNKYLALAGERRVHKVSYQGVRDLFEYMSSATRRVRFFLLQASRRVPQARCLEG